MEISRAVCTHVICSQSNLRIYPYIQEHMLQSIEYSYKDYSVPYINVLQDTLKCMCATNKVYVNTKLYLLAVHTLGVQFCTSVRSLFS